MSQREFNRRIHEVLRRAQRPRPKPKPKVRRVLVREHWRRVPKK